MSEFHDIIGQEFDFYGVCCEAFKIDDKIFEAVADGNDGYRSYLDSIPLRNGDGFIFFHNPIARVKIENDPDETNDGYRFIDVNDGHIWLRFGTDSSDDYYPMFIFHYQPKKGMDVI